MTPTKHIRPPGGCNGPQRRHSATGSICTTTAHDDGGRRDLSPVPARDWNERCTGCPFVPRARLRRALLLYPLPGCPRPPRLPPDCASACGEPAGAVPSSGPPSPPPATTWSPPPVCPPPPPSAPPGCCPVFRCCPRTRWSPPATWSSSPSPTTLSPGWSPASPRPGPGAAANNTTTPPTHTTKQNKNQPSRPTNNHWPC